MPRELCANCERPVAVCYCSALVQIANKIKVVLILHPLEQKHPFNTGRIAQLCLSNSELIIAETFSDDALEDLLSKPSALLYPSLEWLPETDELNSQSLDDTNSPTKPKIEQLIVIDATWRKSKKILHLHPPLQSLPRLSLSGGLTSNYQIRKTSMEDGLSTIESIVEALQILEPEGDFKPMLKPFEKMVALQQSKQDLEALGMRRWTFRDLR